MNEFSRFSFRCGAGLLLGGLLAGTVMMATPVESTLMPMPASLREGVGRLSLTPDFRVAFSGLQDARLIGAVGRTMRALEIRSGLTFARTSTGGYALSSDGASAALLIECGTSGEPIPRLGEDESYALEITPTGARLRASAGRGVLHGLATIQQLFRSDAAGWYLPEVTITDRPRFPWRGLMIDVCRHWQPMEVLKRNLDGMALVKLNVLHLHLTEDQGFRIESRTFPKLHELGSDGHYFTQAEMRELIAYAADRGIRVVPEFDVPGHATSWVTAYPELASAPGPYMIERKWGVFNPVLDPTNEEVYRLLDGFLGEMAALFPDDYLHIGGDENNGKDWSANPGIQEFIRTRGLKDNAGLHAWFNGRVNGILKRHGKKLIGWDEILHPDLPAGSVVHSWRGPDGIAAATAQGFPVVLSNGYYIDLCYPTVDHYLNDPVPPGTALTAAQQTLVLGGEATMWSEWVTPETIDSRIWPRTAAIAERLWSPREVRDVPDMYRRLASASRRLEEIGLNHDRYLDPALRRLAGDGASAIDFVALHRFVDLLEPVKGYKRGGQQPAATQFTPLTGLVDCARPDSAAARFFAAVVERFLANPRDPVAAIQVSGIFADWGDMAIHLMSRMDELSPQLAEAVPLLEALADVADTGPLAADAHKQGRRLTSVETAKFAAAIKRTSQAHGAAELPISRSLTKLLNAVSAL